MIQLANFEEREFYVMLGKVVTSVDVTFTFQMTEEEFTATLRPVTSTLRASKFTFQATTYPEGQYIVKFVETGQTTVLATVAGFVSGNPIFATSQYNTYNDDGTSTTYVPSDDQGLVPSVSQKLRVSTVNESTDVSYVRYIKVTNGTLTDNGDNSVTIDTEGAKSLTDLTDVLITGFPANNILRFDAISAKWKNVVLDLASLADTKGTPAEGKFLQYTGGFWQPVDLDIELNDLSDVDTSNEDTFKILRYDGTNWIADNVPMVGATGISVLYPNNIATISLDANLADLNNVANLTPGAGQVLTWSSASGEWQPAALPSPPPTVTELNNLDDVTITTPAANQILRYSGSVWENEDLTQYHDRYQSDAATFRSGATATTEIYYSAIADGDGYAESASSDTPATGYDIRRKLYYSEAGFADPDTGTWVQFATIPDDTTFASAKATLLAYLKARTGGTVPISLKMTWEEVAEAPTFTGLLNETYGSGAAAAYGTRRLNGLYTGPCMTIRRASDGTTTTIGFVGEDIDESAIETFCTGTTCTVQVWHDQSQSGGTGSGNDATQTTAANQPTIYTGGALVKEGGRVAVDFNGSTDSFDTSWSAGDTSAFTAFNMASPTNNTTRAQLYDLRDGNDDGLRLIMFDDANLFYSADANDLRTTAYVSGQQLIYSNYASSTIATAIDGATTDTLSAPASTSVTANATLFRDGIGDTFYFNGKAQEAIFYGSDKSTDRTDIEGNISDYYQSAKLLNEQYGEGAAAAYSVRQLNRDYTGAALQVERSSDNTTQDIGFDSNGDLDESALTTFCTGTTCKVRTWYDQSVTGGTGSGNDATQTDHTKQPTIYTGGAIVKQDGRVGVDFDGSTNVLVNTTVSITDYDFSIVNVNVHPATTGVPSGLFDSTSNNTWNIHLAAGGTLSSGNRIQSRDGSTTGQQFVWSIEGDRNLNYLNFASASSRDITVNGVQTATNNTNVPFSSLNSFSIGATNDASPANYLDAIVQEVILYGATKSSADQTSVEENIGDYFTQNTPLLDTYTGAAAAYSLRKLRTAYTGSAIRVRRASDNAESDVNFNVFGELDTVSLASFCSGTNGFVVTWYDQSGNGNDATQSTTSLQPKIYDGTTGVHTKNGRPALDYRADKFMTASSMNIATSTDVSYYWVGEFAGQAGTNDRWTLHNSSTNYYVPLSQSDSTSAGYVGITSPTAYSNASSVAIANRIQVASAFGNIYHLGEIYATTSVAVGSSNIGAIGATSFHINGDFQEFILYDVDRSGNRTNIEDNINTFYSIY